MSSKPRSRGEPIQENIQNNIRFINEIHHPEIFGQRSKSTCYTTKNPEQIIKRQTQKHQIKL